MFEVRLGDWRTQRRIRRRLALYCRPDRRAHVDRRLGERRRIVVRPLVLHSTWNGWIG